MGSEAAATHLIEQWPKGHRHTFVLIQHMSWKPADQNRLAEHFLSKKPFASAFPYEAFASFMSADRFLAAIERVWPEDQWDRNLLMYHLGGILDRYEAVEKNRSAIEQFVSSRPF
jgi:hypothetical protein